jgi:hypothetical protein
MIHVVPDVGPVMRKIPKMGFMQKNPGAQRISLHAKCARG